MSEVWPPGATSGALVRLTNPDKVLYPATGTPKSEVFRYYTAIAEVMLPHIAGRPATRKRWPDGVAATAFFEKALAPSAPAWLRRATLTHRSGATVYPIIDSPMGLAWIAQQAALEIHVPQWRFGPDGTPGPADRLVFDLDPGEGVTMDRLCEVAFAVRELTHGMGLMLYPVTSGSKGLHLYAPLRDPISSAGATTVAHQIARQLELSMPDRVTATMTRSVRAGKVFLDWSQNNAAKTTVAPYSLRGRETPTVAAPRTWDEIGAPELRQLRYDEVLDRVVEHGDLLAGLDGDPPRPDRLTGYRRKPEPSVGDFAPMLATPGSVDRLTAAQWAFEGKYDGYRMLVEIDHGTVRLQTRNGRDVSAEYPQLQSLADGLAGHHVIVDGEVVAPDDDGVPSFQRMQNRARGARIEFWAFDVLHLDGRSLLRVTYRDRRRVLETLAAAGTLKVPALIDGEGPAVLAYSRTQKWEGVVAKKWDSVYQPGRRSRSWIKDKNWITADVVIGGWRAGEGGRSSGIGALLVGVPGEGGLRFLGRVGTGFTESDLGHLREVLAPLRAADSPFDSPLPRAELKGVTFVRPELVGEVRFGERTPEGRLRHPSWRGLRTDRRPADVADVTGVTNA